MAKYLDYDGLLYFWAKIKAIIPSKTSTTPVMNGTAAVGSETAYAAGNHVHPTDTSRAPVSHASSATTYGTGTSSNYGHVKLSDATNGTAAAASGGTAATPKAVADAITAARNGMIPSSYLDTGPVVYGDATNTQVPTSAAVADLVHGLQLDYDSGTLELNDSSGPSTLSSVTIPDTKNTAGSTNSSSKLFLVGATSQAANPQTYSHDTAYVGTDGHLYSDSKQVVNLSGSQALTNKTYNGYTLGAACAKAVDTSIASGSTSTNVPTTAAVEARIASAVSAAATGAVAFKGVINAGTAISNLTAYTAGWYWVVGTAGTYVGQSCEAGDMIFCTTDYSSAYSASDFTVVQNNLITITNAEIDTVCAS